MTVLRSAQFAAVALIIAAGLGLGLANSPLGPGLFELRGTHLAVGQLDLSLGHWVTDGLLAVFFLLAAVELKHELRHGELDSASKAFVPVVAAVGGVVVPNAIVLPVFAFVATLVVIPNLSTTPLGPVFWAILVALPIGKVVGTTGGALLARAINRRSEVTPIPLGDLLTVAALGGSVGAVRSRWYARREAQLAD